MHSTTVCATCTTMRHSEPQWSGSVLRCFHNALQCIARHCNGLQSFRNVPAMHCNAPQYTMVCLSGCLLVCIRHPGKTADWIGTWLGMVVGVGLCIGILDFGGDRQRGRGSFGRGMFRTFHCNQWDCLRERWQLARRLFPNYFGFFLVI